MSLAIVQTLSENSLPPSSVAEDWRAGGFGLYLHWPFCQAKCPYCDFNSHVAGDVDQVRWRAVLLSEIARVATETPDRVLNTVFFGGGTPSLMDPDLVAAILDAVRAAWPLANDLEVTLEANPTSVEAGRFRGYRDAGVNRVSMGIQALNDSDLRRLGRLHSVAEARNAFAIARNVFDRVSFDLIYARQHQTRAAWRTELREAMAMAADHLSLYQLTIEPGTAFGRLANAGRLDGLPDDDRAADMYADTQEICGAAGLPAYEISNHARPGAESRHNLIYWRGGDYAGIGPGAHGRLTLGGTRYATQTPLAPAAWLERVERAGSGELPRQVLAPFDQAQEYLMMALRLREGAQIDRWDKLSGSVDILQKINGLDGLNVLHCHAGTLALTDRGRPVLNAVLRELLAEV
ncbi:coproporphyrinogen III oxidase [Maritimibacter sp. 55A14]|uniref:radical SAM family heme chaperone HemW n=1 Tax=Maritimibacter sp. 55A14 TaxID=2174844 RepID=UPI000D607E39|nr:radical SAM family heme chaperone HemW [Maritimibacter sp. 55A14]PWE33573.1 coproporphyrinogen III oxidase [Maritimibacter sp. 55A14]